MHKSRLIFQQAVYEVERKSSTIQVDDGQNGTNDASSENSTEHSTDHSDDHSSSDGGGGWQAFAHARFQSKSAYSYSCTPLQSPLLPKKEKTDILVGSYNN